jgi:hypothetical protein
MASLTQTRPANSATRTAAAPLAGMAIYLLAGALTQPYDLADWLFAILASGTVVVVVAAVAFAARRAHDARTTTTVALVLALLALASVPFLFWLGIPEVLGATAVGLALETRATHGRWTLATTAVLAIGLIAACLGAVVMWVW